jgi:hypothetical protein
MQTTKARRHRKGTAAPCPYIASHFVLRTYNAAEIGNVIVTVVPTPRSLRTPIVPPFSSTLRFAIVSPSPVPVALVEKYV